jgi:hypothetical protein
MTLPVAYNQIAFSQVNVELGRSATLNGSLNEAVVRTLAGVGASPAQIAFSNLHGKSATPFVDFSVNSAATDFVTPYSAVASITLNADGTMSKSHTPSGVGSTSNWAITPAAGFATGKWAFVTVLSGSLSGGSTGWVDLTGGKAWSRNRTTFGTSSCSLQLEFALSSGGAILTTSNISLTATCDV